MRWTVSALAVAAVIVGSALMAPLKAAEDAPYITVYEANVTDMDGYKNQFLAALQPKIDKVQERWLARGGKTTSLIGKAPENRIVMSIFPSKAKLDAFWAEAKDDFKIGQKYSTGMRFFAMPAITPVPTISGTPILEVYEANVTDMENYKNEFLKALQPKMEKHKQVFLARGSNAAETLIGEAPKNRIAITVWPNAEAAQAFWNEAKDDFKIGQKYATDMRIYEVEGVAQK
jgi:uncharacterized protein (DUF1330 family)